MNFSDLGPLLVESDGLARPPGGARLSTILAVLLSRPNEAVGAATLIEAVWGPDAPPRSAKVLESHVWRLRKVLEPERGPRAAPSVLLTDPTGYRLAVTVGDIDSVAFTEATRSVRNLLADHDVESALITSDDALSRWRGEYCADVVDTGWMPPIRERLTDLRFELIELRATALMESGQPERAVNELTTAITESPLRERLWFQRILGLYRSARQGAALSAYDHVRTLLRDELGVDPGPELIQLHRQILDHDAALAVDPRRGGAPVAATPSATVRLPSRRASILGRRSELSVLGTLVDTHRLVTIVGPGGVGKTRLAIEVAFESNARFPDGVWFLDLSSISRFDSIPALLATTLALRPAADTDSWSLVLDHLKSSRAMLVMDNCEHLGAGVSTAIDTIIDATDRVAILATSREPLEVAGEQRFALLPLPVPNQDCSPAELQDSSAVALFLDRSNGARPSVNSRPDDARAIARICAAVGGLPLGIELAAARARTFEVDVIVRSLEKSPGNLTRSGPGPQRHSSLLETVDWGYRLAGRDEQVLHARLSVYPGAFTLDAAQQLCSYAPLHEDQTLNLVGGLVHRSLLVAEPAATKGGSTSFLQLVPIRAHAGSILGASERTQAEAVRDSWVYERVIAAPDAGADAQPQFYDWLDDNHALVRAVLKSAIVERRATTVLNLLTRLVFYWHDREQVIELIRWAELTQNSIPTEQLDPYDKAVLDAVLGCTQALGHNTESAISLFRDSVPALSAPPPGRTAESARVLFVVAVCAWSGDVFDWSTRAADAVLDVSAGVHAHAEIGARGVLAAAALIGGDRDAALRQADAVLSRNESVHNNIAALFANVTHSIAAKFAGDGRTGLRYCDEVLRTQLRLGTHNFAESFETRGTHLINAGEPEEAVRYFGLSSALSTRQSRDWPWHPGTAAQLDQLRTELGPTFDEQWNSGVRMSGVDPTQLVSDLDLELRTRTAVAPTRP